MKKNVSLKKDRVDFSVFIVAVLICACFYGPMVLFPETANRIIPPLLEIFTSTFDWCFEVVAFFCVIFSLWLIFGKYGKVKLGGENAKPQFSTLTWISMIFCAGLGAGILYWACIEPMSYISEPPLHLEPFSNDARLWAMTYTCFHWSITPWAIYAIPSVVFAYKFFNRKSDGLRASYACSGVLGKYSDGILGNIIDIFVIIGLLGGLATSLGFVFPFVSGLISNYMNIPDSMMLKIGVGFFFTLIVSLSCIRGLYSGISKLSNINMVLFILMAVFILFSGPTMWILSFFFESLGNMLQHFLQMSFYMDSVGNDGFAQNWTVFYWAWQFSWCIYIGLFSARVSEGRTIRSFVVCVMLVAGFGVAMICAIIGAYSQHVIFDLGIDLFAIATESGNIAAVYTMFSTLPFANVVIPCVIVILLVAQATGIDSAAYTLSNISCKKVDTMGEPPLWLRLFWAIAIFFSSLALIVIGGMESVKISAVMTSLPILVLVLILSYSFVSWLREDYPSK